MTHLLSWLQRALFPEDHDRRLARLRAAGLLRHETYAVRRGFVVAEYEDEGPLLFLELSNGSVLCLTGQYLDDYGINQRESDGGLPSTELSVLRNSKTGSPESIQISGNGLVPDAVFPACSPFAPGYELFDDFQIITDRPYAALLREHANRRGA